MQRHSADNKSTGKSRGARRRLRLLFIAISCYLAWAGFTFWQQSGTIQESHARLDALEGKLTEITMRNDQFKQEIEKLNDPEYIEQILRKDYHMGRPDEIIFFESE
ncbi:FtsB family cell division protein [Marinicrinis lubricantis]|uniref:Septum formation initiator family protein n=1 Tax=Marinicrinis lubricantis TaxID=2086470 RepID=A0ABW1IPX6_9BACL